MVALVANLKEALLGSLLSLLGLGHAEDVAQDGARADHLNRLLSGLCSLLSLLGLGHAHHVAEHGTGANRLGLAGYPRPDYAVVCLLVVGGGHGLAGALALGLALGLGIRLLEELELTLLGDEASVAEALDSLQAGGVRLLGDNATGGGLHQVSLLQTASGALSSAVEYLCLGAYFHGGGVGHLFFLIGI